MYTCAPTRAVLGKPLAIEDTAITHIAYCCCGVVLLVRGFVWRWWFGWWWKKVWKFDFFCVSVKGGGGFGVLRRGRMAVEFGGWRGGAYGQLVEGLGCWNWALRFVALRAIG